MRCVILDIVRPWGRSSVVPPYPLFNAIDVKNEICLVGVDDDKGPNGLCLELICSVGVSRVDKITDLDSSVAWATVGFEVTLVKSLRFTKVFVPSRYLHTVSCSKSSLASER